MVARLKNYFKDYPILSIDEFRKEFGDGSLEKELQTRYIFSESVIKHKKAIIEFSGGETLTSLFIDYLEPKSFVVIEVQETLETCLKRMDEKDFLKTPYPKFDESLKDTIIRLDQEFKKGIIKDNFKDSFLKYCTIDSNVKLSEIPLKHCEVLLEVVKVLKPFSKALFTFGSFSEERFGIHSDLDLFMLSSFNQIKLLRHIKSAFPTSEVLQQRNHIIIYHNGIKVDLKIVRKLSEAEIFYKKSNITDVSKTILVGYDGLSLELEKFRAHETENLISELRNTMARLKEYTYSLNTLSKQGDRYKYYFHHNIVIHEYVRFKYLLEGGQQYDYLPHHSYTSLDEPIWRTMLFDLMNDDMQDHALNVNLLVNEMMLSAQRSHPKVFQDEKEPIPQYLKRYFEGQESKNLGGL